MSDLRLVHFENLDDLVARCDDWDDLWQRSEVSSPARRASVMALWVRQFAPDAAFHALGVEQHGKFVAAMPLVGKRLSGLVKVGGMPTSAWCACGDLLLDPNCDVSLVLSRLLEGLDQLPWPLLWLDGVPLDADRWTAVQQVARDCGMKVYGESRFDIPRIELADSWDAYQKSWSRNHRRNVRRTWDKLRRHGTPEYEVHADLVPDQLEPIVRRAFELEKRSWKAQSGTTIANTPGMADFYLQQSILLAQDGHMDIAFLNLDGESIAYDLGWKSKGVYHSFKVSYDERYVEFRPGQVLLALQLERFHNDAGLHAVDGMGPLTEAFNRWHPGTYRLGRLLVAPRHILGRVVLHAYQHAWPSIRRWRTAMGF